MRHAGRSSVLEREAAFILALMDSDTQLEIARILTSVGSRVRLPKRIFDEPPSDWHDLEVKVCQILSECGCSAQVQKGVKTVRGRVKVDVVARDETRHPHQLILCECKHWKSNVPQSVVRDFRNVVADTGANLGYIISNSGFQSGAYEAAHKANIRLVTWMQFQRELFGRWFEAMEWRLTEQCDMIYDLQEMDIESIIDKTPMGTALRIGGGEAFASFEVLRRQYAQLLLASSSIGAGKFRVFPFRGIDPATGEPIEFTSPRRYFDSLYEAAPSAFLAFAVFLRRYGGI